MLMARHQSWQLVSEQCSCASTCNIGDAAGAVVREMASSIENNRCMESALSQQVWPDQCRNFTSEELALTSLFKHSLPQFPEDHVSEPAAPVAGRSQFKPNPSIYSAKHSANCTLSAVPTNCRGSPPMKPRLLFRSPLLMLLTVFSAVSVEAQDKTPEANYDEAKVPKFVLPELLKTSDGKVVATAEEWTNGRRAEVLQLVQDNIFGTLPPRNVTLRTKVRSDVKDAINGLAHRREVTVFFTDDDNGPQMDLLVYTPIAAKGKVPAFLGYNFNGNHSIEKDPRLHITDSWVRNDKEHAIDKNKATEASRGSESSRWAVERIIRSGYGLVTIYYGDVDPDFDDGFANGIHALFEKPGRPRAANAGGSISAWAWGLSRALDILESDAEIDAEKVAVFGHSRLGKTSLWAGATDQRFAMVISNNSGCGGAALSKREFGERVGRINRSFPHWFCLNHRKYNENEQAMPVDHHMLIALSAPRPVYVASAVEDTWADPKGEYLGLYYAGPVFELFGKKPLPSDAMPLLNQPVMTDVAYHIRSGKHDVTDYDWEQYIKFADSHLR